MDVVGRDPAREDLLQIARHMIVIASGKILSPSRSFKKLVPRANRWPRDRTQQVRDKPARDARVEHHWATAGRHLSRAQSVDRVFGNRLNPPLTYSCYRNSSNCASLVRSTEAADVRVGSRRRGSTFFIPK